VVELVEAVELKTFCHVEGRCNTKSGGWFSIKDDVEGTEDVYCDNNFFFLFNHVITVKVQNCACSQWPWRL
jgi:hypothetical protein